MIVDISLKGRDGIDLVQDVRKHYKDLPTLVLSMHDESRFAERSLLAGAKGYIMKRETSSSIVEAIRCVLSGRLYVSEKLKQSCWTNSRAGPYTRQTPMSRLTDREMEVFQLLGQGLSTGK